MNLDQNNLIYLYCLTASPYVQINLTEDLNIYSIESHRLFITVKNVSENEFSEDNIKKNLSNEAWLDKQVRDHISVIGKIMETETVLPFNFGTIYKSEESLKQFVDKYHVDFFKTLKYLENKEEWSVKIYCDKIKIIENISILSKNISDIESQIISSSPGKSYILGKKKNEIIAKEINDIYNSCSRQIFTKLKTVGEEYRLNTLLSNDVSGRDEDMIVNATFLIKNENIENLENISDQLIIEYKNIGLILELTGPWPPYTFIKLTN